jgi:type II secretory pathway component PulK
MLLAIESFSTLYVLTRSELEATKRRLQESEQERDDLQAHIELLSNLLIDSEKRREVI